MKLYRIDSSKIKTVNIAKLNPTCKAIVKAMYKIEKENQDNEEFVGKTGSEVLEYCVENKLWTTKQDPSKFITTWNYYSKLLKDQYCVFESGKIEDLEEEFLEEETEVENEETETETE